MSLLIRINLVLGVVSAGAACVALYACWTILEGNARREVLAEAGLMMESAVAMLAHIECLLAGYIGPLAKHLVKRAAAPATGRADLIARLTAELDAESDRSAFAQRCKQLPSA